MSHSRVFDDYAAIMSDKGLIKTAAEKETDYDVKVPAAGPDTPVDDTGYELVELAHPEQIQVARSQLEDGVIENGVEQQKAMVDVALRNPRGVLAEMMKVLVKAANVLESDLTEDSLKMAAEIDSVLEKLAQQTFYTPDALFSGLLDASKSFVKEVDGLDWSRVALVITLGEKTEQKDLVEGIAAHLRNYIAQTKGLANAEQKSQWNQSVAAIVKANAEGIANALADARTGTFFLTEAKAARRVWRDLVEIANSVPVQQKPAKETPAETTTEQRPATYTTVPKSAPSHETQSRHNYSAHGPEVEALQKALGMEEVDGKFGPHTFAKLMETAAQNYNLKEYLHENPGLAKGYQGWSDKAVQQALSAVEQYGRSAPKQESPAPPLVPAPDKQIAAKRYLGAITQQKYPAAEYENGYIYLSGVGKEGPIVRVMEDGKLQLVSAT